MTFWLKSAIIYGWLLAFHSRQTAGMPSQVRITMRTSSLVLLALLAGCLGNTPDHRPVKTVTVTNTVTNTVTVPGATTSPTDPTTPVDNDDVDGDGWTVEQGDCNDGDAAVNPAALDDSCDGLDQNCDGVDNDAAAPVPPTGASTCGGVDVDGDSVMDLNEAGDIVDCNDNDASVYPGATEIPYDGIDQDCSGSDLTDVDGDGFAATAVGGTDCDDMNSAVNPDAAEILDDGIDQNCIPEDDVSDGVEIVDADNDGYAEADDCDDNDAAVNPGATEIPYNEVDEDCDGLKVYDVDCDGFALADDCDDNDPLVHDTCAVVDPDADGDGSPASLDCNDNDATVNPDAVEIADDGIDQDCNGSDLVTVEACAEGTSIVSGTFTASAGSTFVSLYGRRVGPNGELIADWFNDDPSWTDGSNDPVNMEVTYTNNVATFTYNTCATDAGAVWIVNGEYTDANGVDHWVCENGGLSVTASVLYDSEVQVVLPLVWDPNGFGCDANFAR